MLRSLFSGVSGMKNNQIKMDVIGNNISNVSTTAFKAGRVRFQDIFSQSLKNAQGPITGGQGGTNPRQVGLGSQVAGIDTITTAGSLQPTGRPLDCAVQGEGYFIASKDGTATNKVYTRDGSFSLDSNFNIVNSDGYKIMGYLPTAYATGAATYNTILQPLNIPNTEPIPSGTALINNFSIGTDGVIKGVYSNGDIVELGKIGLATFPNPAGLSKLGGNNYSASNNSGPAEEKIAAGGSGKGDVIQSTLEMSNVDLASEFTDMIITSRAFAANSKTITTSDEMLQGLIALIR